MRTRTGLSVFAKAGRSGIEIRESWRKRRKSTVEMAPGGSVELQRSVPWYLSPMMAAGKHRTLEGEGVMRGSNTERRWRMRLYFWYQ